MEARRAWATIAVEKRNVDESVPGLSDADLQVGKLTMEVMIPVEDRLNA